jgi:hypothetical protein
MWKNKRSFCGLREKDCEYFVLHATADFANAGVWREQIQKLLEEDCDRAGPALGSAGRAAKAAVGRSGRFPIDENCSG